MLSKPVSLKVNISFELEPASFDMEGFKPDPITCSEDDAAWSMTLPKIISSDAAGVVVELVSTDFGFTFNGVDTLSLEAAALASLTSEFCLNT